MRIVKELMEIWLNAVCDRGKRKKCPILAS